MLRTSNEMNSPVAVSTVARNVMLPVSTAMGGPFSSEIFGESPLTVMTTEEVPSGLSLKLFMNRLVT